MPRRDIHDAVFWDGAAWAVRYMLAGIHLLFGVAFIVRPNLPLIFPSFAAFDDRFPASYWGWWSLIACLLLVFVPTRVPLGLISTLFSAYFMFVVAITYADGAGLVPGVTVYGLGCGSAAMALFARALS